MNILPETDSKQMTRFEGLWTKVVRPNIENIGFGFEWAFHARSGRINTTNLRRISMRVQWNQSQAPQILSFLQTCFFYKKYANPVWGLLPGSYIIPMDR